jgi:ubiquinone/menaquinone biosynthesis C-methylase UbiE
VGRFDEGVGLFRFFEHRLGRGGSVASEAPVRLLDLGTGNGGIALAFANSRRYAVYTLDHLPNRSLAILAARHGVPVRHVIGTGTDLPYPDEAFDVVLLVDVIEHVRHAKRLGREIVRVLRPGGACLVSTAPRLRYLWRADPHYGLRGLVGLPNWLQRIIVNYVARRRSVAPDGRLQPAYDVTHTYTNVREIAALFPGAESEALYATTLVKDAGLFSRDWWRWHLRGFLFDHVLVTKPLSS